MDEKITVAVIGAGVFGLAAAKNFLEEGFSVTVFESRSTVGGLWKYDPTPGVTTALKTTVTNVSKYKNIYSDFPYPEDALAFPNSAQLHEYLERYAKHFNVLPHIRFNTNVLSIRRNANDTHWTVTSKDQANSGGNISATDFDKLAICTGFEEIPNILHFKGENTFQGKIMHTQDYKGPESFAGKRVLVLGLGNSAADTAITLVGHASTIYLSHNKGASLIGRFIDGKPCDLAITRRMIFIMNWFMENFPMPIVHMVRNSFMSFVAKKSFVPDPSWALSPPPVHTLTHHPLINDELYGELKAGRVLSVSGLSGFTGPSTAVLSDGKEVEVEVVICSTGYDRNLSLVENMNLTDGTPEEPGFRGKRLARLYQNIFPPKYANSVAYFNNIVHDVPMLSLADLAGMAVAQVWKGAAPLPSEDEMNRTIDKHIDWICNLAKDDTVYPEFLEEATWHRWAHETAGTGILENLGYGLDGWRFWWRESKLCKLLLDGVDSTHMYRLFDGRRKKWDGAKDAILAANAQAKKLYG